ncbi:MAG: type II toxin-antitoxin system RelE/ParE family toxin [Elusimicrobia bacterium]|nr:type II toxin-antitoxin system RelE/ParE family toxin [Elusimicrobiota bacterium]
MYKVVQFVSARGEDFVEEFVRSFPRKVIGKILARIEYLARYGPEARPPYVRFLRDKIYELRLSHGALEIRILYFYCKNEIVLTHGFLKKTDAVPPGEIKRAIGLSAEYFRAR